MTPTQLALHTERKARLARMANAAVKHFDRCYDEAMESRHPAPLVITQPPIHNELLKLACEFVYDSHAVEPPQPSIREIQEALCLYYQLTRNELLSNRRQDRLVRPRQVGFYLCRELTTRSMPEIGRMFGGRDHTTIIHALRKIDSRMDEYRQELAELREGFL